MSRKTYEELVWQLARLPGGAAAAMPDFFGNLLAGPTERAGDRETWPLADGNRLVLDGNRLSTYAGDTQTPIATLPRELLDEAVKADLSPLLLGLLALATGDVEGDRLLKKLLPRVDGATKDLMLMTVCRLCG